MWRLRSKEKKYSISQMVLNIRRSLEKRPGTLAIALSPVRFRCYSLSEGKMKIPKPVLRICPSEIASQVQTYMYKDIYCMTCMSQKQPTCRSKGAVWSTGRANMGILHSWEKEWGWSVCSDMKRCLFQSKWERKARCPTVHTVWFPLKKTCVYVCWYVHGKLEEY